MNETANKDDQFKVTKDETTIPDKWVGAGVMLLVFIIIPLLIALWCAGVGVMARAWHWMLGGF